MANGAPPARDRASGARRLWRLWAIVSVAWIALIGGTVYRAWPIYADTEAGQQQCFVDRSDQPGEGNPFACFDGLIVDEDSWNANPLLSRYLPAALAPPLALLALGLLAPWLIARLRRRAMGKSEAER